MVQLNITISTSPLTKLKFRSFQHQYLKLKVLPKQYSNSPASTLLCIVKNSEINYLNHEFQSQPSKKHTKLAEVCKTILVL